MTQTDIPTRCLTLQLKLMDALDAAWTILEHSRDPAEIRMARDKAKAIGELAAVARKVGLITPAGRKPPTDAAVTAQAERLARVMAPGLAAEALTSTLAPGAAQAEHTRRALDKLKGGGRARL